MITKGNQYRPLPTPYASRGIRISSGVWNAILKEAKFGDSPDSVLRRLLSLPTKKEELKRFEKTKRGR